MRKRIAILGSTGSIGTQALEVTEKLSEKFEIIALSAGNNIQLLKDSLCSTQVYRIGWRNMFTQFY